MAIKGQLRQVLMSVSLWKHDEHTGLEASGLKIPSPASITKQAADSRLQATGEPDDHLKLTKL